MIYSFNEFINEQKEVDKRECPVCKEPMIGTCRCAGIIKHDLESLKNGHGSHCENGHRWSYQTENGQVVILT